MDKIFVPLYRFFKSRKALMWTLLAASSAIFIFFGLRLKYEEDISKLVPSSDSSESALAFGSIRVKDKIFLQFVPDEPDTWATGQMIDDFIGDFMSRPDVPDLVDNILWQIGDDLAPMALGYALDHVPSFVDESCYEAFDRAVASADEALARGYEAVMDDYTGSATQMVATDPLELRYALAGAEPGGDLSSLLGGSGFSLRDGHLFSPDGTVGLAFIAPAFSYQDSGSSGRLVGIIEDCISDFEKANPEVSVYLHGAPVRSIGNSRTIKKDLLFTIGLSLLIILLVIVLSFKSFDIVWQNVVPVAYGTFAALAAMYWIKGEMSLMAFGICAIVLGVALSYCLHIIIHHRFVGDVEQMLRDESTPVCLGCITTVGAFLGLLFTKSELLRDFGMFASVALVASTLFALVFLPHFLREGDTRKNEATFRLVERLNSFPYDRNPLVLVAVALLVAVGFIFAGRVTFDSDLRHIGYESPAMVEAEALYAEKNYGGMTQRYYAAVGETLDEALEANAIIRASADSLSAAGIVAPSRSAVSLLFPSTGLQERRIAVWDAYWTPQKKFETARAVRGAASAAGLDPGMFGPFYAMLNARYSPGDLYDSGIVPEELLSNFIEESDGKFMVFNPLQFPPENRQAVDDAIGTKPHAIVVDPMYYTGNMVRIVNDDFNVTLLISSVFVFIVLLLSFRNLLVALLAFLPMFLSWYIVQGIMAIAGLQFNLINIVISTFIFGIGVDYSIFIMEGLLSGARGEGDKMLEYHKAAIFFSAFILVVVVLSLLFARHPAISSIGVSSIIGMLSTIILTYSLQPFLFRLIMKIPFLRRSVTR